MRIAAAVSCIELSRFMLILAVFLLGRQTAHGQVVNDLVSALGCFTRDLMLV